MSMRLKLLRKKLGVTLETHFNAQKPHRIRSLGETQAELLVVIHSDE